jgi:hypothetical protein
MLNDGHAGPDSLTGQAAGLNGANGRSAEGEDDHSELVATVATVGVIGVGAAVFEAALLPGLVLGVAAMWAPRYFPQMGAALQPLFRSSVRGVYKVGQKTREMMAEAQEQVHDIVAEVHAEDEVASASPKRTPPAGTPAA